jgi:hypothetical protein
MALGSSRRGQEPVGWVAVEPRTAYPRLPRIRTVWSGRQEDKDDDSVWAVTCFATPQGVPQARDHLRTGRRHGRVRQGTRRPGAGGLPDDHAAGPGDHLERRSGSRQAACW